MKNFILTWFVLQLLLVANICFDATIAVQEHDTSWCIDEPIYQRDRIIVLLVPIIFFVSPIEGVDELCKK